MSKWKGITNDIFISKRHAIHSEFKRFLPVSQLQLMTGPEKRMNKGYDKLTGADHPSVPFLDILGVAVQTIYQ